MAAEGATKAGQRTIASVVGSVVLVVAVLIIARPYLPIACTVGASGTALNVTVDGWGAGKACETMMNTASTSINGFTPYSTNSFGETICTVPLGSITYTVRDVGVLDLLGHSVCDYLQSQTPAAQASASASAETVAASLSASAEAIAASASASASAEAAIASGCTVGPATQDHNVRMTFFGGSQAQACQTAEGHGWVSASRVATAVACELQITGTNVIVEDTGMQIYGDDACRQLRKDNIPDWYQISGEAAPTP